MEGANSILLVEDEVLLCLALEAELGEAGYQVHIETTGDRGWAALEQRQDLHALVTNIRLSEGPDGWALARRARELYPNIAVVYVSGDSAADHAAEGVTESTMLPKPFQAEQLLKAIASAVDAS